MSQTPYKLDFYSYYSPGVDSAYGYYAWLQQNEIMDV